MADAHTAGLKLLAGRELSAEGLRARLEARGYPRHEIAEAVARLTETGALDDARVARAYARTAADVKGRGRLRVVRELLELGIGSQVAAEAVAEVFGERDERAMIARALQKKLRGRARPSSPPEYARLYQFLLRQGFSPAGVAAALRRVRTGPPVDQD